MLLTEALFTDDADVASVALVDELEDGDEGMAGSMHPQLHTGEDVLPARNREVEIARITLDSMHSEVTSIRARRVNDRITYRFNDEMANK